MPKTIISFGQKFQRKKFIALERHNAFRDIRISRKGAQEGREVHTALPGL